jgi:hypothetical protein
MRIEETTMLLILSFVVRDIERKNMSMLDGRPSKSSAACVCLQ